MWGRRVWSEECGEESVECGEESVECGGGEWSVGEESVECGVWSVCTGIYQHSSPDR